MSVLSHDPDTTRPFDRTATHLTCARRGVEDRSMRGSTGRRRRASLVCPLSVRRHSLVDTFHTLSVRSHDPDTTISFDSATTHWTCAPRGVDERSTARFDWTPAPRVVRVPGQRLAAVTGQRVPHLERVVARRGDDVAIRQDGDALDLRPRGVDERSTRNSTGRPHPLLFCARAASGGTRRSTRPTPGACNRRTGILVRCRRSGGRRRTRPVGIGPPRRTGDELTIRVRLACAYCRRASGGRRRSTRPTP